MENKKIFIVIPAYNEEKKIGSIIQSLQNEGYSNILVVNDGSVDRTAEVARQTGAEVLNMIINRGQGAALSLGIDYLKKTCNPDIIVTFDADGQHRPEDIASLMAPILENKVDIAIGSRFLEKKSKIPPFRKIILKSGVIFTRFVSQIKISDTHNGFRALGKKAINLIQITQRGMEHSSEIIDEIKRKELVFKEVPVEILYTDYSKVKGQKNSNFVKIGLKVILKKLA